MKLFTLLVIFNALVAPAYSKNCKKLTVGVIDTGFGFQGRGQNDARLCPVGHKDFTDGQNFFSVPNVKTPVPLDFQGHGTNIAGIIETLGESENVDFCIVVLKFYNPLGPNNLRNTVDAINYAAALKLDFVNYSAGGEDPNPEEKAAVEKYLDQGGTLIVAAGNSGVDLDDPKNSYYPAQYDKRIYVAGMLNRDGTRRSFSNYGSAVNRWEVGEQVEGYGLKMSGTSQSAAVTTGKLLLTKNRCE